MAASRPSVLVVSRPDDAHGDLVVKALADRGISVGRTSADSLTRSGVSWRPGQDLVLHGDSQEKHLVSASTTVWWRRLGWPATGELGNLESQMVSDEVSVLSVGLLEAAGVRWVDAPWAVYRAGLKTLQLATAVQLHIPTPASLVTNIPDDACKFRDSVGPLVGKAASSGVGITPYVDQVPRERLNLVASCPVLLQALIQNAEDCRVVTIANHSIVWRRCRKAGEIPDWRQADPFGRDFRVAPTDDLGEAPTKLAAALGLSFSVQDWLITEDGPLFLEVNPRGQWLFLDRAEELVIPILVDHLVSHG